MISTGQINMSGWPGPRRIERRRHPRYAFTAEVELIDANSGLSMKGRTSDLSCGGCYVEMFSPLPKGTFLKLRITKWQQTFEAQAKVAYSRVGMGMGLTFTMLDPTQRPMIETWIGQIAQQPC
jgi:PilZ domain